MENILTQTRRKPHLTYLLPTIQHISYLPFDEGIDVDVLLCQKLVEAAAGMAIQEGANMGVAEG